MSVQAHECARAITEAEIATAAAYWATLEKPYIPHGKPESLAFRRVGVPLEAPRHVDGVYAEHPYHYLLHRPENGRVNFGGTFYVEFPNSTLVQTKNKITGAMRSFLLARGVRDYHTTVDLKAKKDSIKPHGYVSDVLVFEINADGTVTFVMILLKSDPESFFFFEDPRSWSLYDDDGGRRIFLSGTDYSPHTPVSNEPDVVNRYTELDVDDEGSIQPLKLDGNGRPFFMELSPMPVRKVDGVGYEKVDAKNGTIVRNEDGHYVARTRLRLDFKSSHIRDMAQGEVWKYGEQVFVFRTLEELHAYEWIYAVNDLFKVAAGPADRVRPLIAQSLMKDSQLIEQYDDAALMPEMGKGLGPGTTPVRLELRGDSVYVSDGKFAPELLVEKLSPADLAEIGLVETQVTYLSFDHEIRYLNDKRGPDEFTKRHYTMAVKQFDPSLTAIEAYYADVLQPRTALELGFKTAIGDLHHIYAMGREIILGADGRAKVRLSVGISDAHTQLIEVDLIVLLKELAPGSARWKSGQIYKPQTN